MVSLIWLTDNTPWEIMQLTTESLGVPSPWSECSNWNPGSIRYNISNYDTCSLTTTIFSAIILGFGQKEKKTW